MRNLVVILLSLISLSFLSCSNDEINTDVSITGSTRPLIPGTTASCYALKTTPRDQPIAKDISSDYFTLPSVSISRANPSWQLVVFQIRLTVEVPTMSQPVICAFGGDTLLTLDSRWWEYGDPLGSTEAIIPAGQGTIKAPWVTDCALKCGGIDSKNQAFVATGRLEIFAAERNPSNSNDELPVKIQTFFTVQSY